MVVSFQGIVRGNVLEMKGPVGRRRLGRSLGFRVGPPVRSPHKNLSLVKHFGSHGLKKDTRGASFGPFKGTRDWTYGFRV